MTCEDMLFYEIGEKRGCAAASSRTARSNQQAHIFDRVTEITHVIEYKFICRIIETEENLKAARALMSATTEIIAVSHETIARSRALLDRCAR
jgi:hypothetical protein